MALQKEIWILAITAMLFADNGFAARSVDHSMFSDNSKVHVPGSGAILAVSKNTVPASGGTREDVDVNYTMDKYYVPWITVQRLEQVELTYNKRESVVKQMVASLNEAIYSDLLTKWLPSNYTKMATTGDSVAASAPSATGNRNATSKKDVLAVKRQFDKWNMPQTGRCLLLDADMYNQLLSSLTDTDAAAFLSTADAAKGIVGRIYGFDVYERSTVYTTTAAGALKTGAAAATDCLGGLAWCETAVSRAVGEINVYDTEGDPTLYGDAISADVNAGGSNIYSDSRGILLIYQGTV
jgi:hypothetical protein